MPAYSVVSSRAKYLVLRRVGDRQERCANQTSQQTPMTEAVQTKGRKACAHPADSSGSPSLREWAIRTPALY